jgi:hypothetical protein
MKVIATSLLLLGLTASANAAVVWDESINGLLSTNPNTPTPLVFSDGSNIVNASVFGGAQNRDYITFTVPAGSTLTACNLLLWSIDDTGFCAVNAGNTSVIPSNQSITFWLAGIHVTQSLVGTDLFDAMHDASVTLEALGASQLDPGEYTLVVQQVTAILEEYSLEFVMSASVPTAPSTWGKVKALYR